MCDEQHNLSISKWALPVQMHLEVEEPAGLSETLYNRSMPIDHIIITLQDERDRLTQAIDALSQSQAAGKRRGRKPGSHMSAAARKRISEATKKRWAEWRKKQKKAA
ncbi:MAG TPA: hypothetical protein VIX19_21765 [Terriglobales bacterium]